jgi:hypothetical protein
MMKRPFPGQTFIPVLTVVSVLGIAALETTIRATRISKEDQQEDGRGFLRRKLIHRARVIVRMQTMLAIPPTHP